MRRRTLAVLDYILGKATSDDIDKVEDEVFAMSEPKVFSGKTGVEVKFIKMFEETCILLSQHTPQDPKSMTVLEFYSALETIKKQMPKGRPTRKNSTYVQPD